MLLGSTNVGLSNHPYLVVGIERQTRHKIFRGAWLGVVPNAYTWVAASFVL